MELHKRNFSSEIKFRTSRSSGASGQHVNTTETKVELIFNVKRSAILSPVEKETLLLKWENKLNDKGELKIACSRSRSQASNKEQVIEKFYELLSRSLKKQRKRIATKIPKAVKDSTLKQKKLHAQKKGERKMKTRDFL